MARSRWLGCALGALVLAGCGGGEAASPSGASMGGNAAPAAAAPRAENAPPRVERVRLEPAAPRVGEAVEARAEASDPDGDPVRLHYAWTIDGRSVAAKGRELRLEGVARGSRVEVAVVANDGRGESEPVRASATVANQPPRLLRVEVEPEGRGGSAESLLATVDVVETEGDEVRLDYEWSVDGRAVEGSGPRLPVRGLARGSEVRVRVVASDPDDAGDPMESAPFALGNRPPEIARAPLEFQPDGTIRHRIEAHDPDGDRSLRFWLSQAPEGAEIDAVLGELSWRPTRKQVGTHVIEVAVSDGHGGEARQPFEVEVREVEGSRSTEAAAAPDEPR